MTINKEANITPPQQQGLECCMCGDSGLSNELFQCKVCQFRSQHSYCSNLYPQADSYGVCNWCLNQKEDTKEKSQNSSNSSSSYKNNSEDDSKNRRKNINSDNNHSINPRTQRGTLQLQLNGPIKKPRSPDRSSPSPSPSPSTRKRIITNGALEEKLRRTKSEEVSHSKIIKHVFKNKVRRYKLLDEVSS